MWISCFAFVSYLLNFISDVANSRLCCLYIASVDEGSEAEAHGEHARGEGTRTKRGFPIHFFHFKRF